jgi:hypothetical protein
LFGEKCRFKDKCSHVPSDNCPKYGSKCAFGKRCRHDRRSQPNSRPRPSELKQNRRARTIVSVVRSQSQSPPLPQMPNNSNVPLDWRGEIDFSSIKAPEPPLELGNPIVGCCKHKCGSDYTRLFAKRNLKPHFGLEDATVVSVDCTALLSDGRRVKMDTSSCSYLRKGLTYPAVPDPNLDLKAFQKWTSTLVPTPSRRPSPSHFLGIVMGVPQHNITPTPNIGTGPANHQVFWF